MKFINFFNSSRQSLINFNELEAIREQLTALISLKSVLIVR